MKVKRLLSAVTAFVMIVSLLPQISLPVMAAGEVIYKPHDFATEKIMNINMMGSDSFFNKYVKTNKSYNNSEYTGLSYNMTEKLTVNSHSTHIDNVNSTMANLWKNKELKVKFGGTFRGDKHGNVLNHGFGKSTSYQYMSARGYTWHKNLDGPSNDNVQDVYSNWISFYDTGLTDAEQTLVFQFGYGGCYTCGTPKFSKPVVAFADSVQPTITGWFMSTTFEDLYKSSYSRDEMYICVEFSEAIRFADHSAKNWGDVYLGLQFVNKDTNQEYKGDHRAYLYALQGNMLVFRYEIPEKMPNGQIPNHYIAGFTGIFDGDGNNALKNTDSSGSGKYNLKLFEGTKELSSSSETYKAAEKAGYTKSKSFITDLAGNEVGGGNNGMGNLKGSNSYRPLMDLVNPYVEKIDLVVEDENGNAIIGAENDSEIVNLFTKAGAKYRFTVQISEKLTDPYYSPDVKVNVKDENGEYIKLSPNYAGSIVIPNNPPEKQLIYYEFTLTDKMTPAEDEPVQIIEISAAHDHQQNALIQENIPAIAQQAYPDLLPPVIITEKSADNGIYEVHRYDDNTIAFDFTITDDTSHGKVNTSGILPLGDMEDMIASVTVSPVDDSLEYSGLTFDYAIAIEGSEPEFSSAALGNPIYFPQAPGGKKNLYIRPGSQIPVNLFPLKLSFIGSDIAGNECRAEFILDEEDLIDIADVSGPEISIAGNETAYDDASGSGNISVEVSISDMNNVSLSSVEYAWTENGVEPQESDWVLSGFEGTDGETVSGTITKSFPVSTDTEVLTYDLYIRANDMSSKKQQTVKGPLTYSYNRLYPSFSVYGQETGLPNRAVFTMDWEAYTPPADGVTLNAIVFVRPNSTENPDYFNAYHITNLATEGGTGKDLINQNGYLGTFKLNRETGALEYSPVNYNNIMGTLSEGRWYGTVEAIVQVGYGLGRGGAGECEYPVSQTNPFILRAAGDWRENGKEKFDVTAEWESTEKFISNPEWDPNATDENGSISSLVGNVFTVNIAPYAAPEFGLSDIDYENSYAELVYIEKLWTMPSTVPPSGYNVEVPVTKFPLTGGTTRIIMPDNLPYFEGIAHYKMKVHVQTKSGRGESYDPIDFEVYANDDYITIDNRPMHAFGLAKMEENIEAVAYPYYKLRGTTDTWFGIDTLNSEEDLDNYVSPGTLVLGTYTDGTYITEHSYTLSFSSKGSGKFTYQYMQLRNKTPGVNWESNWNALYDFAGIGAPTYVKVVVYETAEEAAAAPRDTKTLPIVAGVENVIEYQARTATGYSQNQSLTIVAVNTVEPFTVTTDPVESDELITEVRAYVSDLAPGTTLYRYNRNDEEWQEADTTDFAMTMGVDELLYVKDMQGNIIHKVVESPDFLFTRKPTVGVDTTLSAYDWNSYYMYATNVRRASVNTRSDYQGSNFLEEGFKLHVSFNEEYAERIGVSSMTYDIPARSDWNGQGVSGGHRFTPDADQRRNGIFSFDVVWWGAELRIDPIMFVHRYDENIPEGETESVTLSFTVEDRLGNISDPASCTFEMENIKPKLLSVEIKEDDAFFFADFTGNHLLYMPSIKATVPIAEAYPNSNKPELNTDDAFRSISVYDGWLKPFASVYRDGVYDISFVDMFGDYYRQTITQPVMTHIGADGTEYNAGMDISFSDPDPETGKVTMHFKALDSRMTVDIAQGIIVGSIRPSTGSDTHTILASNVSEASVELDPDQNLYILRLDPHERIVNNRYAYMNTFTYHASVLPIPNFVYNPPVATVEWYFDEFGSNTLPIDEDGNVPSTTSQNVTAYLKTETLVNPINAKSVYHTFTYGEDDSYTFEFEDYYGTQGSLTVSLSDIPITLTEPVPDETDTTAPEYTVEIYGKYNSMYESQNEYSPDDSGSFSGAIEAIDYVQGYLLSFQVADESPTKLVVKEKGTGSSVESYKSARSDVIDGVKASGTQVSIDKESGFDVVIIDANDNKTVITVDDSAFMFDLEAPQVEDIYKDQTNFYEVTAYIKLKDNVSSEDEIRWIYPTEARKVTIGEFAGRYALVFDGNGSINIRYADALGNEGTSVISVDELDESTPTVTKVTWSPGDISIDGKMDSSTAPTQKTNKEVVAVVEFSTQVQELNISRADGEELYSYYISALLQDDQAIITFHDSLFDDDGNEIPFDINLDFTGVNGITGTYNLKLGAVIDKRGPGVWPQFNNPNNPYEIPTDIAPYVEVSFKSNEDFYIAGNAKLYKGDEGAKVKITENGKHKFSFTDAAGNVSQYELEISCIDNMTPVVLLGDLPETGYSTNGSVTFKATLNEAGTVTINGETKTVKAPTDSNGNGKFDENECHWVTFSVSENGGYQIVAKDQAGLVTEQYITINCIDHTAPRVEFTPSAFNMIAGSDVDYVKEILMNGITVYDAVSKTEDIAVEMSAIDESILKKAGVHTITYFVTDKAGNKATGKRYLRIYPADEPQILLNGVKTFSKEVALLNDTNINLSVSNMPGGDGEPYTVYLRQGRWSAGQMKRNYQVIDSSEFTVEKNKYYTLYIVTQSRGTFLTNFYVQ